MAPSDFKTRREIAQLYGHVIPYSRLKKLGMKDCVDGPPVIRRGRTVLYHVPTFERWLLGGLPPPPVAPPSPSSPPSAPKRRGRPTKAETIRRRQKGDTSKAAEAFDVGAGGVNA